MPIIIKTVGVTIYGGYILLISAIGFIFGISSLGVGFKYKRYFPASAGNESRRKLFYPQFLFQLMSVFLLSLLIVSFNRSIKNWLFANKIEFMIILVPLLLLFNMFFSQSTDYFRYSGRMGYFNFTTVAMPYVSIGIVVIFLYSFRSIDVNLLVLSQILAMLLLSLPLMLKIFREIGFCLSAIKVDDLLADMKLGFPLTLTNVTNFILRSSDRYVIAFFISVTAVGYYSPAYTLGSLIIFFPMVSGVVLPPLLSKAVDNGRKQEAQVMVNYTIMGFLLISIPFVTGSYVLGRPILNLLANADVAEKAYLIVPVIAIGTIFYGLNVILNNVLFVQMRTKTMFWINTMVAIINLVLNLVLIYVFRNIMIAALSALISYCISFIIMYRIISNFWKVGFNQTAIMKSISASILMMVSMLWVFSYILNKRQPVYILCEIVFGGLVYLALLFIFRVFSDKELTFLKKILSQWKRNEVMQS